MNKKSILAIMILFVGATAFSLQSASLNKSSQTLKFHKKHMMRVPERHPGHPGQPNHMDFFKLFELADKIDLTNTQLIQLRLVYQKNKDKINKHPKPEDFPPMMHKDMPETSEEIAKIASQIAKKIETDIKERLEVMNEFRKVLTKEQQDKLKEIFARPRFKGPKGMDFHHPKGPKPEDFN